MVTRNDRSLGLSNGDVGITLPPSADKPWRVAFARDGGNVVEWSVARLGHVETAFACTIHKAQGSEYDHVAVVVPSPWQLPCTREALYTAITRARSAVTVVGDAGALMQAVRTRTVRHGGLQARLRQGSGKA
jgi:exodeoxyribonuclease V alpha subunit